MSAFKRILVGMNDCGRSLAQMGWLYLVTTRESPFGFS